MLELWVAVDKTGQIPQARVERAEEFGAWVKTCYGTPVGSITPTTTTSSSVLTLKLPKATSMDRVSFGENLAFGQLARAYEVSVQSATGQWLPFASGTSIGNKAISIANQSVTARLTPTQDRSLNPILRGAHSRFGTLFAS